MSFFKAALVAVVTIAGSYSKAQAYLPDDAFAYTVQVGCRGDASGFLLSTKTDLYLVTARHVFFEPKTNTIDTSQFPPGCPQLGSLVSYSGIESEKHKPTRIYLQMNDLYAEGHVVSSQGNTDLAIVKLGVMSDNAPQGGGPAKGILKVVTPNESQKARWVKLFNLVEVQEWAPSDTMVAFSSSDLLPLEKVNVGLPVYIFGFPQSLGIHGIYQIDYDLPLVRHGIVASKNRSPRNVALDCLVLPGNSGGPVVAIVADKKKAKPQVSVLGIISDLVPADLSGYGIGKVNSGYSIAQPTDELFQLISSQGAKQQ